MFNLSWRFVYRLGEFAPCSSDAFRRRALADGYDVALSVRSHRLSGVHVTSIRMLIGRKPRTDLAFGALRRRNKADDA